MEVNNIVENSILIPIGEYEELKPLGNYLWFGLTGALITKSRNESNGNPCIVVQNGNHYEVHRIVRKRI